jgi:hypothetical protein
MRAKLLFFGIFLSMILYSYAQPANNDCANAEAITVSFLSATNVSYDPSTATQSTQSSCDSAGSTYYDVWYSFTMPGEGNIQIVNGSNSERFTLYDACGGNEIACFNGSDFFIGLSATSYVLRVAKLSTSASADTFTINTFEKPINDECATPLIITDDITTQRSFNYDNRGATESLDASCDTANNTHLDVWYEFTMPVNGNIHLTGVNTFDRFTLYDSCGGTEIICSTDDSFAYNLSIGTYLLRVSKRSIYASADSFNIQAFATVANDECATAEVITDDITTQRTIMYDNRGATESLDAICDNASSTYLDLWYEFTMPVNGNVFITNVNIFDRFTIYDACGGTEIICDADTGTYLLRVSKQAIYASADSFRIQAFATVANDECVNAELITDDITTERLISYDNRGATESLDASCDSTSNTHLDIWYEFTMPVDGNIEISGVNIFDEFTLYDSCGGSELACFSSGGFAYNLTTGTYFLRVYKRAIYASADSFRIQAFAAATNDECATATLITEDITTQRTINFDNRTASESLDASCDTASNIHLDIWYEFTMPVTGNLYISGVNTLDRFTLYDGCGGNEIACFNGSRFTFNLTAGTYYLRVYSLSTQASQDSFNIQAYATATNDECVNAEVITDDISTERTIVYQNRGATESLDASCDSPSNTHLDLWYEFTMPFQGNVEISSASFTERFTLYDSCGGSEIACFSGSSFVYGLSPGTYFLRVSELTFFLAFNDFDIQAYEALPNDNFVDAAMISVAGFGECTTQNVTVDFRRGGQTGAPDIGDCFSTSQIWVEAWYKFEAPLTGNINLNTSVSLNTFAIYDGCNGAEVACFAGNGVIPVVFGNTYYIQVARVANTSSGSTFCLEGALAVAPGMAGVCESIPNVEISTAQGNTNEWVPILDASGDIVAAIDANGNDLGTVTTTLFIENADTRDFSGQPYLRREVSISTSNAPSSNVNVRLYLVCDEVDDLMLADSNLPSINGLEIMKVNGNTCTTGYVSGGDFINATGSTYLDNDYYIQFSTASFSVFYPTSTNLATTLSIPATTNNALGIEIIPTITTGTIYIKTDKMLTDVAVDVFDITGRKIYQTTFENLHQTQQSVELSNYQSGMYFVKITHQNTHVTQRILLK